MKQTINSKVYNSETAEELAECSNGLGCSDFSHCYETLYKTKQGAFFLYGEGGPMSRYSESCGNSTSGGSAIVPLTEAEALEWCEDIEILPSLKEGDS